jgi:hypothetical protein
VGSDASRFTYEVPVARPGDTLPPSVSRTRLWRNSASVDLLPLSGVQLRVDGASTRDLRDYGDSTTIGRLMGQGRAALLGWDIGVETQRTLMTLVNLTPRLAAWIRPRAALTSTFAFTRDPNARQPFRELDDTAGPFRVPAAFSNARRMETGAQLDPRRLGQAVFGDSAGVVRWLARVTSVDVAYTRQRASSFNRAGGVPSLGYQFGLGGMDDFRHVGGLVAGSAAEHTTLNAGATAVLLLGLRANATYRRSRGVAWVLRAAQQVPIRTRTRDWPNGTLSWSVTPPRRTLGRVVSSLTAQVVYRRRETANEQPGFGSATGGGGGVSVTRGTERALGPSVALTWVGGVLTAFDAATERGEQLAAGNLFRSARHQQNATLVFAFRPPASLGRWQSNVRTTVRYSASDNTSCLRSAGQATCVPYVDSRRVQAQLTMDTDLPPNMNAGFQMAYLLTEERQTNRKVAQVVITAFVQLATSVGQLR